jgi:hypothetical protein
VLACTINPAPSTPSIAESSLHTIRLSAQFLRLLMARSSFLPSECSKFFPCCTQQALSADIAGGGLLLQALAALEWGGQQFVMNIDALVRTFSAFT